MSSRSLGKERKKDPVTCRKVQKTHFRETRQSRKDAPRNIVVDSSILSSGRLFWAELWPFYVFCSAKQNPKSRECPQLRFHAKPLSTSDSSCQASSFSDRIPRICLRCALAMAIGVKGSVSTDLEERLAALRTVVAEAIASKAPRRTVACLGAAVATALFGAASPRPPAAQACAQAANEMAPTRAARRRRRGLRRRKEV